jgi:hypothetical protein
MDYLWRSCSGELSEQNDLFRLTYALETAKDMLWNYRLLNDREWAGRYAVTLNAGVNGIYLSRTHLDAAFDDNGRQINPLLTRLTGNVADLMPLFSRCGWLAAPEEYLPAPPVYADGRTGSARKGGLVADLRQVVFSQTGHFHDGIAVNAVLQHGAVNFQSGLTLTF